MVISCGADHPETIKICYLVIMNGDDLKKIVFLFFFVGGGYSSECASHSSLKSVESN